MPLKPKPAPQRVQREVDLPGARAASVKVVYVGLLMLGTLVCSSLPLPWQMAGIAFALGAVVVGLIAMRQLVRSGVGGVLVPVLVTAIVFSGFSAASFGATLVLWPIASAHQDCVRDSLTISARDQCEKDYRDALQAKIDLWTQSVTPSTASASAS